MRRYLFVIGCQKAGTTLMYSHLSKHPDIDIGNGEHQEQHFFDRESSPTRADFDRFYEEDNRWKLDVTPAYIFYKGVMEKIAEQIPVEETKIIVILRNPINRAISHYHMSKRKGRTKGSFDEAIRKEKVRIEEKAIGYRGGNFVSRGLYYEQITKLYSLYKPSQVKILIFEDFVKNQEETIKEVLEFIDIEDMAITSQHANKGFSTRSHILAFAKTKLAHWFRPVIPLFIRKMIHCLYKRINHKPLEEVELSEQTKMALEKVFRPDLQKLDKLLGTELEIRYLGSER